jgi:hypothetical protein
MWLSRFGMRATLPDDTRARSPWSRALSDVRWRASGAITNSAYEPITMTTTTTNVSAA